MGERQLDRFSQIYLFGGQPKEDSERFRVRLAALYEDCARSSAVQYEIHKVIQLDCGIEISAYGVSREIGRGKMRDILDIISIIYRVLQIKHSRQLAELWKEKIPRLLAEENLAYRIDENCVVQRLVDEEFYRSTVSAIQALDSPWYTNAADALEQGLSYLTSCDQNTKGAVISVFEAGEIIAKYLVPTAQNLNAKLCETKLLELCRSPNAGEAEKKVEAGIFKAMAEWVNAVHNYRHGQAESGPVAPSMELAVQLVSMGCSFIRRLAKETLHNSIFTSIVHQQSKAKPQ